MENKLTSIEDLMKYAQGVLIDLPPFGPGQPFAAKLRRPSLLSMTAKGKIPNTLKVKANELFQGGNELLDTDNENMMKDLYDILMIFANAALVSPTMEQIEDAGIELTDEQLMFIFNYAQEGVKQLESFREEQTDIKSDRVVEDIQPKA